MTTTTRLAVTYRSGAELPDLAIEWRDRDGNLIDFSSGWTFTVKVGTDLATAFTKTTGITGAATSPNVLVQWATSGELSTLAAGQYRIELTARRTSDSKDRAYPPIGLTVLAALP